MEGQQVEATKPKVDPYHKRFCQTCQSFQPVATGQMVVTNNSRRWRCARCSEKINRRMRG